MFKASRADTQSSAAKSVAYSKFDSDFILRVFVL